MQQYYPEGALIDTPRNQAAIRTAAGLAEAALEGQVLEARAVVCDAEHNPPNATSSTIMTLNPTAKNTVPRFECCPCDISGISSSTTT